MVALRKVALRGDWRDYGRLAVGALGVVLIIEIAPWDNRQ
jgi:hypothetical protein